MLDLSISIGISIVLLFVAFIYRRYFISFCFAGLALFCTFLPAFKLIFGGALSNFPLPAKISAYGVIGLYAFGIFIGWIFFRGGSFGRLFAWFRTVEPHKRLIHTSLIVMMLCWFFRLYRAANYGILLSGSASEKAIQSIPYEFVVVDSLLNFVRGGAIIILALSAFRKSNKFAWGMIFAELLWSFVNAGRREFIFLTAVIGWVAWNSRVLSKTKAISFVVFLSFVLFLVTPLFLLSRDYNGMYLSRGYNTFSAFTNSFGAAFDQCGLGFSCLKVVEDNIEARGSAMEFLFALVTSVQSGRPLLYGEGLYNAVVWALPGVLVTKPDLMVEQLIQFNHRMPLVDDAISIPALAYADFGLLGCFLAGLMISFFIKIFVSLAHKQNSLLVTLSMYYGLLVVLWNVESDPSSMIVLVRNALLVLTMLQFFEILPKKKGISQ